MRFIVSTSGLAILLSAAPALRAQTPVVAIDSGVTYLSWEGRSASFDVIRPLNAANGAGIVHFATGCWFSRSFPPVVAIERFGPLLSAGFTLFIVRHLNDSLGAVPGIISDLDRAVRHIGEVAPRYQVDPSRLGFLGTSAGGHAALTLGLAPYSTASIHARAIVVYFAPTDLRLVPKQLCRTLAFPEEQAVGVSPITLPTVKSPPTMLLTGDQDSIVPMRHSQALFGVLQRLGVATDLVMFPGMGHGSLFGALAPHDKEGMAHAVAWFTRYLVP